MKKIYYLDGCTTCRRVLRTLEPSEDVVLQDIKTEPITREQLEEMAALSGSYGALFSRKAVRYRQRKLHEQELSETDYKRLILEHYTFLRRPVVVINERIFIGSSRTLADVTKEVLHQ